MDDHSQPAESPAPTPAKGRGNHHKKTFPGRGVDKRRGRKMAGRGRGRGKGRGRNKTYDDPRVQAAYERSRELRDLFGEVAGALKPGLEKLAENSINLMIENPHAHEEVADFDAVQKQLDDRLAAVIREAEVALQNQQDLATRDYEVSNTISHAKFENGFNYATDEFFDGALNRATILSEIQREGMNVGLADLNYRFVQEPDDFAANQGPYVYFKNGIEVPYPHLLDEFKKAPSKPQPRKQKPGHKRKAEDLPDGQPETKKHVTSIFNGTSQAPLSNLRGEPGNKLDNGDGASTPRPRHIGGLLSAETEIEGELESNAPSPTPAESGQTSESDHRAKSVFPRRFLPDLPAGASEPDAWGVRTVYKRGPKANNRIIIPPQFDFDDDDIGFRDSTNDPTRKATKASRGIFFNTPNSGSWHLDQTIAYYNCLEYEDDELDPELVRKYKLHPKYGFFLPDSVNPQGPPSEVSNGYRSIVVVTPNGSTLYASRTVRPKITDNKLRSDVQKKRVTAMLDAFRADEDISLEDITTDEIREREQRALERLAAEPVQDEPVEEAEAQDRYNALALDGASELLDAAAFIDEESRRRPPVSSQRSSRSYDAVRDVFGTSEPAPRLKNEPINTYGLSLLADVSDREGYLRSQSEDHYESSPALDPRLRTRPRQVSAPGPAPPPNNFLQTALNPTPAFAHIAPAPTVNLDGRLQAAAARVPFTHQDNARSSPRLPPLRPARREKSLAPVAVMDVSIPQPPQSTAPALAIAPVSAPSPASSQELLSPRGMALPLSMVQSTTGSFFPPAPHRPFHQSYMPEPDAFMPMASQSVPQQVLPMPGSGLMFGRTSPPPMSSFSLSAVSPPIPGHAQLAPMPPQLAAAPTGPLPAPSIMTSPPPTSNSRHRASIPSNGQSSGKYRKIAAAPIPHNRPWAPNGGSELRLSNYDPKGSIKDYTASAPPPRSGPTTIRGWSVNNVSKARSRVKKEDSEDKESPK